jgi:hypothetical protein
MTFFRNKPRTAATDTKRKTGARPAKAVQGYDEAISAGDLERLRRRPTYFI